MPWHIEGLRAISEECSRISGVHFVKSCLRGNSQSYGNISIFCILLENVLKEIYTWDKLDVDFLSENVEIFYSVFIDIII